MRRKKALAASRDILFPCRPLGSPLAAPNCKTIESSVFYYNSILVSIKCNTRKAFPFRYEPVWHRTAYSATSWLSHANTQDSPKITPHMHDILLAAIKTSVTYSSPDTTNSLRGIDVVKSTGLSLVVVKE